MKNENFKVSVVEITPQLAQNFMLKNVKNRKLNPRYVEAIARDMKNGNWVFNGDAIRFSSDGILLDGQHRLAACIASSTVFKTLLIKNIDEDAMITIDGGKRRTYSDHLKIQGYENASGISTALSYLMMIATQVSKVQGTTVFTKADYDAVLDKHKGIMESAALAKSSFYRSDALLAAIHYIATQTGHEDRADNFLQTWKDGQMNYADDPIVFIRNMLLKEHIKIKKMKSEHKNKLIMLSWQKFNNLEGIKRARLSSIKFCMDGWDKKACGIS
jgi:hypothetical protein